MINVFLIDDHPAILEGLDFMTIKRIAAKHDKSPSSIEKSLRVLRQKTGASTLPELVRIFLCQRLIPM
jgi:hypothetical protein